MHDLWPIANLLCGPFALVGQWPGRRLGDNPKYAAIHQAHSKSCFVRLGITMGFPIVYALTAVAISKLFGHEVIFSILSFFAPFSWAFVTGLAKVEKFWGGKW